MSQRRQDQIMMNVRILGFLAAEEFSADWKVKKDLSHLDARASWRARFANLNDLASLMMICAPQASRPPVREW
jgi:hypothetical protein